jgi:hypothetical protein
MIYAHLKSEVIEPALRYLCAWNPSINSEAAINLLVGIAAQESGGGRFLRQKGGGPALGIYQIEPATHDDLWQNYLKYHNKLREIALNASTRQSSCSCRVHELIYNNFYATVIARLLLWRIAEPLPPAHDVWEMGAYWKKHWNTNIGKGTVEDFVDNYERYTGGVK